MKKVPKSEPITEAIRVHISPAPMLRAATPVAIAVRLMLPTNHSAPRCAGVPWRSAAGIQLTEWTSMPEAAVAGAPAWSVAGLAGDGAGVGMVSPPGESGGGASGG